MLSVQILIIASVVVSHFLRAFIQCVKVRRYIVTEIVLLAYDGARKELGCFQ